MRLRISRALLSPNIEAVSPYFSATDLYTFPAAKRVVAGYSGHLYTVLRESNNATLDIDCAPGSDLPDYTTLATFLAGETIPGVGRITKAYDQSGNGRDWTPPITANRPYINLAIANDDGLVPICITGQQGAQPLALGLGITGIAVNRRNHSVFHIAQPMCSLDNVVHWEFRNNSPTVLESMFTSATIGGLGFYNSSTTALVAHPRAMLSFIAATSASTGYRVRLRETTYTGAAFSTATMNSFFVGLANVGNTFNGEEYFYGCAVYNVAQTPVQEAVAEATAIASFNIPTTFDSRIVFAGDSIIHGYLGTFGKQIPNLTAALLKGTPEIFNCGVNGQQMAAATIGMVATASVQIDPLYTAAYGDKCILVSDGGTNDIGFTGISANNLKNSTATYTAARGVTGFKVIEFDLLPRTDASMDGTKQATLLAYNALYGSYGSDAVVRQSLDAIMGAAGASDDTSLYGDKLHPITGADVAHGYRRLATALYAPAINPFL